MKYKGLVIAFSVIGILAIIGVALFAGILWARGWFGRSCFGEWNNRNHMLWFDRGMMWGGNMVGFDNINNCWSSGERLRDEGNSITTYKSANAAVLSIEQAESAVNAYIADYRTKDTLSISEIMIFDNHAYAAVIEEDSGIGAFEVLVDPETLAVIPEMGPNMMWNLKYSHMRGGMMGNGYSNGTAAMPISSEEALALANEYLSQRNIDLVANGHPDRFYGYYTIHTERDGKTVGMLSVNGYDGNVFMHTWHGEFIEMTEHAVDGQQEQ